MHLPGQIYISTNEIGEIDWQDLMPAIIDKLKELIPENIENWKEEYLGVYLDLTALDYHYMDLSLVDIFNDKDYKVKIYGTKIVDYEDRYGSDEHKNQNNWSE